MAEQHLVAYITWNRIVPWKVLAMKHANGRVFPFAYGSRQDSFRRHVTKGSVIWVVTVPPRSTLFRKAKGASMVSLVARIAVDRVFPACQARSMDPALRALQRQWGTVALADPDPENTLFFGLNDSTERLEALFPVGQGDWPQRLQRIRPMQEPAAITGWKQEVQQLPTVFISYVRAGNEKHCLNLARELLKRHYSPWLDNLALPEYRFRDRAPSVGEPVCGMALEDVEALCQENNRLDRKRSPRLRALIEDGIQRSRFFLVLLDAPYMEKMNKGDKENGRTVWVRYECSKARARRKHHLLDWGYVSADDNATGPYRRLPHWPYHKEPERQAAALDALWRQ